MQPIKLIRNVVIVLISITGVAAAQTPPEMQLKDVPRNMKPYFIGFLTAPEKGAAEMSKEEMAELMPAHLAYIRSQIEAGRYALGGPFLDHGHIAGMMVVNASSIEEARKILEGDPMVKKGKLGIEVHPGMLPDVSTIKVDYAASDSK